MSGDTGLHDSRLTDKEAGEFDTLFHDLQCYSQVPEEKLILVCLNWMSKVKLALVLFPTCTSPCRLLT